MDLFDRGTESSGLARQEHV